MKHISPLYTLSPSIEALPHSSPKKQWHAVTKTYATFYLLIYFIYIDLLIYSLPRENLKPSQLSSRMPNILSILYISQYQACRVHLITISHFLEEEATVQMVSFSQSRKTRPRITPLTNHTLLTLQLETPCSTAKHSRNVSE